MPIPFTSLVETSLQSVLKGQLPPNEVISELLSLVLGNCVLLGACITKLPLIINIRRSRSVAGLSLPSILFELVALLIASTYGFVKGLKFSSYGDSVILTIQCLVTLSLVRRYGKVPFFPLIVLAVLGYAAAVVSGHVSLAMVLPMLGVKNVIVLGALLPQIMKNFTTRSTGPLSPFTYFLNSIGCVVRVFTSLQEKDFTLVRDYCLSLSLNMTLLMQILIYGNRKAEKLKLPVPAKKTSAAAAAVAAEKKEKSVKEKDEPAKEEAKKSK